MAKEDDNERAHSSSHSEAEAEETEDADEEKQGGEQQEVSVLEGILPPLPAARNGVFVKLEAVLGLDAPFSTRGKTVSARIFWGGQEVRSGKSFNMVGILFSAERVQLRDGRDTDRCSQHAFLVIHTVLTLGAAAHVARFSK